MSVVETSNILNNEKVNDNEGVLLPVKPLVSFVGCSTAKVLWSTGAGCHLKTVRSPEETRM